MGTVCGGGTGQGTDRRWMAPQVGNAGELSNGTVYRGVGWRGTRDWHQQEPHPLALKEQGDWSWGPTRVADALERAAGAVPSAET